MRYVMTWANQGGAQRTHLDADGSGWFVGPDKIAWDTAGNLTLAGNFRALALHIGQQHGPMIRGGEVIELDDQGAPITEVTTRYGLRIYDTSGLPRIALLTGTLDEPNSVAALFGSESDASYLHYDAHGLRLKGELTASSGAIGGWTITADQLRSRWSALVLDSDGLLLANNEVGIHGADPSGLRVWAGASYDYRANAPFRVYNDGRVYATKVLALEAENAVSGSGVITVANTGSGVAAYGLMVTAAGSYAVHVNGPDGGLEVVGATLPALKGATSGPYPTIDVTSDQSYAVQAQATGADGAVRAIGGTYAIKMEAAPMHAGAQNIEAVNYLYAQRLYLGDTAHYLYLSGDNLYWHNGTTNVLIA